MTPAESGAGPTRGPARDIRIAVALLVVVAGALRFYQLGGQLWLDEISALRGYRAPFWETLTTFPIFFPNPLFDLMAHASLVVLGDTAFAIRLPAALFGVAGVVVFYFLARRCLDAGWALAAGALLAVSYHHIFYSQDARGYTTYLFFALLATDRLVALLESMSWRTAGGYAAAAALTAYAHPFGLFVLAGQMGCALPIAWWHRRIGRGRNSAANPAPGPTPNPSPSSGSRPRPAQVLAIAAMAGTATVLLYAPLIPDALAYVFLQPRDPTPGGPQALHLVTELLTGLRAGLGGWPVLIVGLFAGVVGVVDFHRRHPIVLALLTAPLALAAFVVVGLGAAEIHPRYFLLALPLGYLVGTSGLMRTVSWLLNRALRLSPEASRRARIVCGIAVVAIACVPLGRYYSMPKQDYLGAIRATRQAARGDDLIVAVSAAPNTGSGRAAWAHYDADLQIIDDVTELRAMEASGRRVWVMTTLEQIMAGLAPDLLAHLRQGYELVRVLPGSVGGGAMRIYVREAPGS